MGYAFLLWRGEYCQSYHEIMTYDIHWQETRVMPQYLRQYFPSSFFSVIFCALNILYCCVSLMTCYISELTVTEWCWYISFLYIYTVCGFGFKCTALVDHLMYSATRSTITFLWGRGQFMECTPELFCEKDIASANLKSYF